MRIFDPSSAGAVNVDVMPYSDLVVVSLTKYSGNAGDVMLGAVAVNPASPFADALRAGLAKYAEPGYARDLARLAAQIGRMESVADAINANTLKLARWLETHPAVRRVHWAYSEKSAANYSKIARGPNRPGSLLTVELRGAPPAPFSTVALRERPRASALTFTIVCPFVYLAHYDLVTTSTTAATSCSRAVSTRSSCASPSARSPSRTSGPSSRRRCLDVPRRCHTIY